MRRALHSVSPTAFLVTAVALSSFLAAGCGKALLVTGGSLTMVGAMAAGIPDDDGHNEGTGCNDGPGCVAFPDPPSVDEGKLLVTGLLMMAAGAAILIFQEEEKHDDADRARWAREQRRCDVCPVAAAAPAPTPPPPPPPPRSAGNGVWRDVPAVPGDVD